MKITGREWKEFEKTGWPPGYIWSDDSVLEDGRDLFAEDGAEGELIFADSEMFTVPDYWSVMYQGPEGADYLSDSACSIRSLIRKWRKSLNTVTLVVSVPKAEADDARGMLKARNWSVLA